MTDTKPATAKPEFRRKQRLLAVGGVIDGLVERAMPREVAQKSALLLELQRRWRQVCPMLAAQSWPLEVTRSGVLRVAVASSSAGQELKYMAPSVVDAANFLAGSQVVEKLAVVVQSLPVMAKAERKAPPVAAPRTAAMDSAKTLCKAVQDDGLRDALTRLGAWVLSEKKV